LLTNNSNLEDAITFFKKLVGIEKWTADIQSQFNAFRAGTRPFRESREDPILYWRSLMCVTEAKHLATVALKILSFPQSSAAVERSLSFIRDIHTTKRNKLGRDTLAKLVYVKFNLLCKKHLHEK
jgi:hypothetical protein